jgi:hypothetical protein
VSLRELRDKYGFELADLQAFLPVDYRELGRSRIEVHYLSALIIIINSREVDVHVFQSGPS